MRCAWLALDKAATEAGQPPLSPEVWECRLPSTGEVVAIVRTDAEAHHVARERWVFTLAEVGRVLDALGSRVLEVKRTFPGASIMRVTPKPIDWQEGDDLPF